MIPMFQVRVDWGPGFGIRDVAQDMNGDFGTGGRQAGTPGEVLSGQHIHGTKLLGLLRKGVLISPLP
jgi:hypothetical protein